MQLFKNLFSKKKTYFFSLGSYGIYIEDKLKDKRSRTFGSFLC